MSGPVCTSADTNFIVIPTGGCWADPKYLEVVNRSVITKSIVAMDCSDTTCSNGGMANLVRQVSLLNEGAHAQLTDALNKLVGCITVNNGIISPTTCEGNIFASIIESATQVMIASSNIPVTSDFDVEGQTSMVNTSDGLKKINVSYSSKLEYATFKGWGEFVSVSPFTPGQFIYNWVSYVGEFHSLWIVVMLNTNPVYLTPCALLQEDDSCECEEDEKGPCVQDGGMWCAL